MREWTNVSKSDGDEKESLKKRIARKFKEIKDKIETNQKPFMISAILLLGGMTSHAQNIFGGKDGNLKKDFGERLENMYADIRQQYPTMNIYSLEQCIKHEFVKQNLTIEDAAKDRTSYVFFQVAQNMNELAKEGCAVWKNPTKKAKFIQNIFKTAVGWKSTQSSCLAACSASLVSAFVALDDDTSFLPKESRTYGNSLLAQKEFKDYIVDVKPGSGGIEKAIEENDVQPGDFILVPRNNKGQYHSIMYVGKNEKDEHVYSACNNPAHKKTFAYYNQQIGKYKRSAKIVKMNEKYYDELISEMKKLENEGVDKSLIVAYVYDTMGGGEKIFSELSNKITKLQVLDKLYPMTIPQNNEELEKIQFSEKNNPKDKEDPNSPPNRIVEASIKRRNVNSIS